MASVMMLLSAEDARRWMADCSMSHDTGARPVMPLSASRLTINVGRHNIIDR